MQTLKENSLAEHEKIMLQLTEEKLAISAERTRLETSTKLSQNYDTQRAKAEVEAAMQVAKRAAEMTDRERDNLHKMQYEVESLKRSLVDREKRLSSKERELEESLRDSERRSLKGEQALMEARVIQCHYNDRLKDIKKHLTSLTGREKKLTEEKIALSKERLALHTEAKQMKCCLCATNQTYGANVEDVSEPIATSENDFHQLVTVSYFSN